MEKEKIVLYGMGVKAQEIIDNYDLINDMFDIIGLVDSDSAKWGTHLNGYVVLSPEQIYELKFDKIVISTSRYFDEIKERLIENLYISENKIENNLYFAQKKILYQYRSVQDDEIQEIINYIIKNGIKIFNYPFAEKYAGMKVESAYDKRAEMYYVRHNEKRLYMAKYLNTEEKVSRYYKSICMEQDIQSPHRYQDENFEVHSGDIVLDVGVAEGNFTLDVIDKASKVYMIESDLRWIEALEHTFADYKDKIKIIHAFASADSENGSYRIDDIIHEPVNFIKMDIEGNENAALHGASNIINMSQNIKCAICTYHNDNDEADIKKTAENYGMSCGATRGYMFFPYEVEQRYRPTLRRGVLRLWKGNK